MTDSTEKSTYRKAVVLIPTNNKGNIFYPSVKSAAVGTGIPRYRLFEALASESGLIKGTDPPIYIDLASEKVNVEEDEDE